MNWQEACRKSPFNRAYRDTEQGRYFRDQDGFATFHGKAVSYVRMAEGGEIEGFNDWEPILPEGCTRTKTFTTPCFIRDGETALDAEAFCVGCGIHINKLLDGHH